MYSTRIDNFYYYETNLLSLSCLVSVCICSNCDTFFLWSGLGTVQYICSAGNSQVTLRICGMSQESFLRKPIQTDGAVLTHAKCMWLEHLHPWRCSNLRRFVMNYETIVVLCKISAISYRKVHIISLKFMLRFQLSLLCKQI